MNYGLHLSASGVLTNMYRQDVIANNLANVSTAGFKRDLAMIRQRDPESIEDNVGFELRDPLLDRLGGGVFAGPQSIDFQRGSLARTGNPLDVALESADTFFVVGHRDATTGQTSIRLTRDGRFTRNGDGALVTVAGAQAVLDSDDQPIQLADSAPVTISRDGVISQNGVAVARLQVTAVANQERLEKQGNNLFGFPGGVDGRVPADGAKVQPGFIEASTVDPIIELRKMLDASDAVQANANLIRYHDLLMDRAVNTLGRVVA